MPHDDTDGLRLDRAVDSITVGYRHRRGLGDLQALCDSIRRVGLLGPLTVTPDGLLLCGWRRLEAVKLLGWKTVPVFVRRASSGLYDLIAEHDENTIREPLPLATAEELYREYKSAEAEQAALRQQATRFHATKNSNNAGWKDGNANDGGKRDNNGPAESAGPGQHDEHLPARLGDARAKAAQMVTAPSPTPASNTPVGSRTPATTLPCLTTSVRWPRPPGTTSQRTAPPPRSSGN